MAAAQDLHSRSLCNADRTWAFALAYATFAATLHDDPTVLERGELLDVARV